MQIMMLGSKRGCEDGFTVRQYEQGKQYDMRDAEARRFILNGWAKEVPQETKHVQKYIENKKGWLDCLDCLGDTISREAYMEVTAAVSKIIDQSNTIAPSAPAPRFRPQSTRGNAPANPATLKAKGDL